MIHVGLIDSISDRWPEEVRQNWHERIQEIRDSVSKEIQEIQQFAEHYDE